MIDDDEDEERRDEESEEETKVREQRCIGSVIRSVRTPFCAKFLRNVADQRFEDTRRESMKER